MPFRSILSVILHLSAAGTTWAPPHLHTHHERLSTICTNRPDERVCVCVRTCGCNAASLCLQIVPQEMAENCFWIKVKEERFENPDLFAQLSLTFSSKSRGKQRCLFLPPANYTHGPHFSSPLLSGSSFHLTKLWETICFCKILIVFIKLSCSLPSSFLLAFDIQAEDVLWWNLSAN